MLRTRVDLIFSVALLATIAWMGLQARAWDLRAALFPIAIGIPAILLALLQVIFAVRGLRTVSSAQPVMVEQVSGSDKVIAEAVEQAFGHGSFLEEEESIPPETVRKRTLEMVGWILAIALGIVLLGFELGAGLTSLVFLRLRARESWRTSAGIAFATYLFFYVVFDRALSIPLPNGAIADALGLNALDHYLMDPIANLIQGR